MNASQEHNILLDVKDVTKHFGGIRALTQVSFSLAKGSITSLIGPNGAGKTTFINVVTGIHTLDSGEIRFQNEDIAGSPAHVVASKGIGRTFQLEELFGSLSVLENIMVGRHVKSRSGLLACGFALSSATSEEERIKDKAMENLAMVGLTGKAFERISQLPLGERKLVGVARALSMEPTFLMLDEPAGGLAAHEADRLVTLINSLVAKGLTILIVEHNMPFVMTLSEKIVVLDAGTKIAEGTPEEVKNDERVIRAYLGQEL